MFYLDCCDVESKSATYGARHRFKIFSLLNFVLKKRVNRTFLMFDLTYCDVEY